MIDRSHEFGEAFLKAPFAARRGFYVDAPAIVRVAPTQHKPSFFQLVQEARDAGRVLAYCGREGALGGFSLAHQVRKQLPGQDRFARGFQAARNVRPHDTSRATDEHSQFFDEAARMVQRFGAHWTGGRYHKT